MEERRERSEGSGRSFGNSSGGRSSGGRSYGNSGGRSFGNSSGGRSSGGRSYGNSGGRSFDRGEPAEKHKATCSECGQECEVPFKPTPGKSVYCFECFKEKNPRPRPRRN
ncbi:hypothetical protein AUJ61_03315 [Candidatus Pacearchaeota archaeon CG1_02_30_18]|nr:MAG: hypothetical protein AUJ61_03315 [Candidatus Pacearchaeota archaeon CG1_02_30_18]